MYLAVNNSKAARARTSLVAEPAVMEQRCIGHYIEYWGINNRVLKH